VRANSKGPNATNVTETLPEHESGVWGRFAIVPGIGAAVILTTVVIGWYPTSRTAGPEGVVAMASAAGITWAVFCLSMIPVWLWRRSDPRHAGQAVLAAGAIRFVLVLLVSLPIVLVEALPAKPFLIWVGISYLAVLAADTAIAIFLLSHPRD